MKNKVNVKDSSNRIFEVDGKLETVGGLKKWCAIDATYGKIPLPDQLKSAANTWRSKREYAATVMLQAAAEVR